MMGTPDARPPIERRDAAAGSTFSRQHAADRGAVDLEARTVRLALSSETPVREAWGAEALSHAEGAIDFSQVGPEGLSLRWAHEEFIGRITELAVGADRVLRGLARFARTARAEEVLQAIADDLLVHTSIGGIRLSEPELGDDGLWTVHRWRPLEGSIVDIPADRSVGVNRSAGSPAESKGAVDPMSGQTQTPAGSAGSTGAGDETVVRFQEARAAARTEGVAEGARIERERVADIRRAFSRWTAQRPELRDLEQTCIDTGVDVARAQRMLLEQLGGDAQPLGREPVQRQAPAGPGRVTAGEDGVDKFSRGVETILSVRAGLHRTAGAEASEIREAERSARECEWHGFSLAELVRVSLERANHRTHGLNRLEMVNLAFRRAPPGVGTSDFPGILGNVATKAMLVGWNEQPETWQTWTRTGSLPDFKSADRVALGQFSDLEIVYEDGEYKLGYMGEIKESVRLLTYGKLFSASRQTIINDDLGAFTTVPRVMGRAANRKVGDVVYATLTANPTLSQDTTALFHADHNNLVTAGAAPSVATINAGLTAMALQRGIVPKTGETAPVLNIQPRYLLVPHALRATSETLMAATYDPAGTAGTLTPNNVMGKATVVADARLDVANAAGWYLAADPMLGDTVEVLFLDGASEPFLEELETNERDGRTWKVRIDCAAVPLDYRGLYYNDGVT